MTGKDPVCVVTGASAGIGKETARGMAARGFSIVLIGRDAARTEEAAAYVRSHSRGASVSFELCDFSSLSAVRALSESLLRSQPRLDVLINNAGLWHSQRQLSRDGLEDTFAVNHLAPFLLTNLLLPRIKASGAGRIIHVSSRLQERMTHFDWDDVQSERSYQGLRVYAQSKLANVLFSAELAARLHGSGVTSNALHPGDVVSDILREKPLLRFFGKLATPFVDTPESASRTSIYVATAPELASVSGAYFKKQKRAKASPLVDDSVARAKLWELSERLVGLSHAVS